MARSKAIEVTPSSGNVFADLELPDATELDTKLRLGVALIETIRACKLKQAQVAEQLGITQPKVSALLHYRLDGFSVERLMQFLVALDRDVEIQVRRKPRSRSARIAVRAA